MTHDQILGTIASLSATAAELEEMYIENEGEVTEDTERLEENIASLKELLLGDGIDELGRWLKGKQDELSTMKAEKDAAARRVKAVERSVDYVKSLISLVLQATGREKAKGIYYSFARSESRTTTVDKDLINERWREVAEKALSIVGLPPYVTFTLGASVSLVPEGEDLPDVFHQEIRPSVRFTKPRSSKE